MARSAPLLVLTSLAWLTGCSSPTRAVPLELSFYYDVDLRHDEQVQKLEPIWRRAAAAGYRRVMLSDAHFARLDATDDRFRANVARVRELASQLGLEVVPLVFQVGRSNEMLGRDPDLAEGVPVKRARFVVHGGEARLVADPPVALGAQPEMLDPGIRFANGIATTAGARGRMSLPVRVSPFRCYHVSVKVRSRGFDGDGRLDARAGREDLTFTDPPRIRATQDWTPCDLVFNSLEHDQVEILFGVWKGRAGELDWTDWRIEEVGLLNVLRRPGAPCVVEGFVEGRDYQPIRDPALAAVRGVGDYSEWHEPPAIHTSLPEGTQLRVSWYQPCFFYNGTTSCCPSDSGTIALLQDEATRMKELWGSRAFLFGHDEIRCLNWDASCAAQGSGAAEVLAANVRRCLAMLPESQIYVWSDMFDPFHNARAGYYRVRGDLNGSWEGLSRDVVVLNWDSKHRAESLRFFSGRGNRQIIAGYYDSDVAGIQAWLDAARGVPGVVGVMYTTWRRRYDDLEAFARMVKGDAPGR